MGSASPLILPTDGGQLSFCQVQELLSSWLRSLLISSLLWKTVPWLILALEQINGFLFN